MRPRLLDLFCGAAVGYHRAGFEVVGVDVDPQPAYPYTFHQADALDYLAAHADEFDAIHASPPCQRWAQCGVTHTIDERHPDYLTPMRELLPATGLPYIIENIPTAPGPWDIVLCGTSFGLPLVRHRVFRCSVPFGLAPNLCHQTTYGRATWHAGTYPYAHGSWRDAWRAHVMPVVWPWMTDVEHEAGEAIPPAYTEFIGSQLMDHIQRAAA